MSQNNNKVKVPYLVRDYPDAAALLSKLNANKALDKTPKEIHNIPDLAASVKEHIKSNDSITKLFPDVELAIQILTSNIITPNNVLSTDLSYTAPDIALPTIVKGTLIEIISSHISKYYKIEDKLSLILREALFTKGAYIEAIVPEAAVDEVINKNIMANGQISLEAIDTKYESILDTRLANLPSYEKRIMSKIIPVGTDKDNSKLSVALESAMGTLMSNSQIKTFIAASPNASQAKVNISMEDAGFDITDNFTILAMPEARLNMIQHAVSLEAFEPFNDQNIDIDLDNFFRDNSQYQQKLIVTIKTDTETKRDSIGKPLVFKLPVESTLPVHVINDPTRHLGYFVLLDEKGSPVSEETPLTEAELQNYFNSNGTPNNVNSSSSSNANSQISNSIISRAQQALYGSTKSDPKIENLELIYGHVVETMIKNKLKEGSYGELADIKDNADVLRIMFTRALRAQKTRLLYIPAENIAFYAFDYRENGTGRSLIEKVSILFSIKAILLFSKIMATIKNSTPITSVTATLDPDDPDPEASMESVNSRIIKSRAFSYPIGLNTIDDLVTWVHGLGVRVNYKHPSLPDMNFDISDVNSAKVIPDEALEDSITEQILMAFGLTPEIVKSGYETDYATTVVAKNLLFAKRVMQYQNQFNPMITSNIRKLLINDAGLKNKLKSVIRSNLKEIKSILKSSLKNPDTSMSDRIDKFKDDDLINYIVRAYITEISVSLPRPDLTETQGMTTAYGNFRTALDDCLGDIVSDSAFADSIIGPLANKTTDVKAILRVIILKKWMDDNNYMPELTEFITLDDKGNPIMGIMQDFMYYIENYSEVVIPFYEKNAKLIEKITDKVNKRIPDSTDSMGEDNSGGETATTDDTGGLEDGGDNTATDEAGMGGDEFNMGGDDMGDLEATDNTDDMGGDAETATTTETTDTDVENAASEETAAKTEEPVENTEGKTDTIEDEPAKPVEEEKPAEETSTANEPDKDTGDKTSETATDKEIPEEEPEKTTDAATDETDEDKKNKEETK